MNCIKKGRAYPKSNKITEDLTAGDNLLNTVRLNHDINTYYNNIILLYLSDNIAASSSCHTCFIQYVKLYKKSRFKGNYSPQVFFPRIGPILIPSLPLSSSRMW